MASSTVVTLVMLMLAFCSASANGDPCINAYNTSVEIPEDFPIGQPFLRLLYVGNESQIDLTLSSIDIKDNRTYGIELNQTTRSLVYTQRIEVLSNSADRKTIVLKVVCRDKTSSQPYEQRIYVTITDINDHAPEFTNAPYAFNASETTSVGSVLGTVTATDLDPSDIGYLCYFIDPSSSFASTFSFPVATKGELRLNSWLSYDRQPVINLIVSVMDNCINRTTADGRYQPRFTASTTVTIRVISVSANITIKNPEFARTTYTAFLSRSAAWGTIVSTPNISLADSNANRMVMFSIIQDQYNGVDDGKYFTMNNVTGELRTAMAFDAFAPSLLAFEIKVTDASNRFRYSNSLMRVQLVDESAGTTTPSPLVFTQSVYNATLSEDSTIGTLVVVLRVLQPCVFFTSNATGTKFLFDDPYPDFRLDPETGEVRTTRSLNHSVSSQYSLHVRATNGLMNSSAVVVVSVTQNSYLGKVNDQNPRFNQQIYLFNVTSPASGVTYIGRVQASDANEGSSVAYSLLNNPVIPSGLFTIDADGGVRLTDSVPASLPNPVTLTAVVRDDGQPPRQDTAVVVVYLPTVPQTSTALSPLNSATQVATSSSTPSVGAVQPSGSSENYRTAIIVIGVICGVLGLLLVIIVALLVVVWRKANHAFTISTDEGRSTYESAFRATNDYGPYLSRGSDLPDNSSSVAATDAAHHTSKDRVSTDGGQHTPPTGHLAFTPGRSHPSNVGHGDDDFSSCDASESASQQMASVYGSKALSAGGSSANSKAQRQGYALGGPSVPPRNGLYTRARPNEPRLPVHEAPVVGMDPGTISSTETLMGPHAANAGRRSLVDSLQAISGYLSSTDGSMLSVGTQPQSDEAPGITVYY